ncbi:CaiF/GrlA family transcriptional regulator [Salmonella enterica]|uniref:CaiF/GrlA family transcriptional regulator n=3 Tax=Salmonella enterica TaxID=28901 RepID=A0A2I5HKV3_SALDZ|nr:CaiF/GrlA family transcriptional regulator [Salmonella enterica]EBR3876727.1 CaiF/GrlA family transcriptional regulator [Salmonella enterica subsp. arizonae]EBV2375009.1 CaiF/GrlA family transcriptional regulator [Salmonella enterica subsp. enterica serovar Enteritidis]EDW6117463.1 CaiF/GrlA family transcriptional regulator [Salmonella enterica subsp. salamae]EGL0766809.1 CaiF/GrlA family transcriptional regulator [Salmonella enterica subsp. enterica]EGY8943020.1 CaiF/GrlA family transcript
MEKKREQHCGKKHTSGAPVQLLAQSNHDTYFLPEGLEAWAGEPLYILVALWCMHQGVWVNRNQIAAAFRTGCRRASMVLGYISRRTNNIDCQCRMVTSGKPGVKACEILVTGVRLHDKKGKSDIPQPPVRKRKQAKGVRLNKVGNAGKEERELLRQLWGRRAGNSGGG